MGFLMFVAVAGAAGFGYMAYKYGYKEAAAMVAGFGALAAAYAADLFDKVAGLFN